MRKDIYTFADEQKKNLSRVTDVSAGICPLGPSNKVKAAIRRSAKEIGIYPDPEARRLRRFFLSKAAIEKDRIIFCSSREELINAVLLVYGPKRVLLCGPFDPEGTRIPAGTESLSLLGTEGSSFLPEFEQVMRIAANGDLLIISNPNLITGRLYNREGLLGAVRELSASGVLILLDETMIEFTSDSSFCAEAGRLENLVLLRSTASFHGLAGLELAVAVAPPPMIAALTDRICGRPGRLALDAAYTALTDKTYSRAAREFTATEKKQLYYEIRRIPVLTACETDSCTYLMKVESGAEKLILKLAWAGFLVQDCGAIEGLNRTLLRMSVMSHDKNRKLVRVLKEFFARTPDETA